MVILIYLHNSAMSRSDRPSHVWWAPIGHYYLVEAHRILEATDWKWWLATLKKKKKVMLLFFAADLYFNDLFTSPFST